MNFLHYYSQIMCHRMLILLQCWNKCGNIIKIFSLLELVNCIEKNWEKRRIPVSIYQEFWTLYNNYFSIPSKIIIHLYYRWPNLKIIIFLCLLVSWQERENIWTLIFGCKSESRLRESISLMFYSHMLKRM